MNKLIVGDKNCSFSKVVRTMCSDLGKVDLFKDWFTLALHLETSPVVVKKLEQDLLLKNIGVAQVATELLTEWRSRDPTQATMSALLGILEKDCKWKYMADELHGVFKMEIEETTKWTDLDMKTQNEILERVVEFLGSTSSFKFILSKLNDTQQQHVLASFKGNMMLKMLNPGKIFLTREILPELPKLYIPRTLSTRRKIDPKIFQTECPDIFVVENISLIKLSEFSGKHRVDKSYRQAEDLTVRFISLDSPDHFEDICEQAKHNSVHLINYKEENFYWVKTHGNLHQIQAHLHDDPENISEAAFPNLLDDTQDNLPICIADNPGMGKTLLLATLCKLRRSQNPEKFIIYSNFAEIFGITPDNHMSKCKPSDNTWQKFVCHLSENEVGREILTQVYMTEPQKLELFLDGFDEVPIAHLQVATNNLNSFATNLKGVQVYATTRVHRQVELERALGTLSFNILPFNQSDQVNFFRDTWNREYSIPNPPNLEKFARFLVTQVRSKFSSEENDITGVPLQCSMLAEIYQKSAKRNAKQSEKTGDLTIRINSVHEMYEKLLKLRFQKIEDETRRNEVLRVHQMAALELLLPSAFLENSEKLFQNVTTRVSMQEEVNRVGLVSFGDDSSQGESIRFFHRTYAEFILADWWVTSFHQLNNTSSSNSLHAELNKVLLDFHIRHDALIKILFAILDAKRLDGGIKVNTEGCGVPDIWKKLCGSKNAEKCRQEWMRVGRALNLGPEDIAAIHGELKYNLERKDFPEKLYDILWLMLLKWTDDYKRKPLLAELVDALHSCGFDDLADALESEYYTNSFHHHTLCFFLNIFVEKCQITLSPSTSDDFMIPSIGESLDSCMSTDFMNIFRMISRYSLSVKDCPLFQSIYKTVQWARLLLKLMRRSSASQLEECCAFVEEMEGKPLHQIETGWKSFGGWELTPLHLACERGDLSSFLFLSKKYEHRVCGMKGLLHNCTWNSLDDSEEVINARIEMIGHLLKINSAFLEEREPLANSTPILMDRVHWRLLKFLMEKGADPRAVDEDGFTVVRKAAVYFSPEDFHRLTKLLLRNKYGDLFLMRDKRGNTQLQQSFQFAKIKVETVELIATHINIMDSDGTRILGSAIWGLQKREILETLVKFIVDPKRIEDDGETMVHWAAVCGHVEAIGYLCSLGCDVNARHCRQRTALHAVVTIGTKNLDEVVMALLEQQIDVNAIDDEGRSALWYAQKEKDFRKLKPVTLKALQDAAAGENPS